VARSTIARLTGLSPASVTGHSADLTGCGLLLESAAEVTTNGRGRPHVPVDLDTSRFVVGALHVAVEHSTVALLDIRGTVVAEGVVHHGGRRDPATVLERGAQAATTLIAEHARRRTVLGLGVATGGWVEPSTGTVVDHPMLGWRDVPVTRILENRLGMPVLLDSHSRALVRAEQLIGHARARESALILFVGNVVDMAFATGDRVHRGFRAQAGTVAHLPVPGAAAPCECGRAGCLQAAVSERTLVRRALAAGLIDRPSVWDLLERAEAGNEAARRLFADRAALTGRATALLTDIVNPEVAVVVEPGIARFPECLEALRTEFARYSSSGRDPETTVLPTSFPHAPLAVAAGAVLLDALYRDPLSVVAI
jgi:predicted NBD/HSP70 family sugar kinase